ncbi:hypothetical protein S83_046446, partial [Arachis hypogaea]
LACYSDMTLLLCTASYLGLKEFLPPYLDQNLTNQELISGVSFASDGSGYDTLTPTLSNVISIQKQLEHFKEYKNRLERILGKQKTEDHMKNAIFFRSAGTNNFVINYFTLPIRRKTGDKLLFGTSYEVNSRGIEIFCKSWLPEASKPKATQLERVMGLFSGIARKIALAGYRVFAMDYPGFGLSQGLHGYIPNFDGLVDDVIEHYSKIKAMLNSRKFKEDIRRNECQLGNSITRIKASN